MSTLNIVNKSPFEKRTLEQCLQRVSPGDSILLIEDASVAAVAGSKAADMLADQAGNLRYYVLAPDLAARGFGSAALLAEISSVDYTEFVELVTQHDRVHSWL